MRNRKLAVVITILLIILAVALSAMLHGDEGKTTTSKQSSASYTEEATSLEEGNASSGYHQNSVTVQNERDNSRSNISYGLASFLGRLASFGIGFIIFIIIIAVLIIRIIFGLIRSATRHNGRK